MYLTLTLGWPQSFCPCRRITNDHSFPFFFLSFWQSYLGWVSYRLQSPPLPAQSSTLPSFLVMTQALVSTSTFQLLWISITNDYILGTNIVHSVMHPDQKLSVTPISSNEGKAYRDMMIKIHMNYTDLKSKFNFYSVPILHVKNHRWLILWTILNAHSGKTWANASSV